MLLQTYLTVGFILSASMISFSYINDKSAEFTLKSIMLYTILCFFLLTPSLIIAFLFKNRRYLGNPKF